MIFGLGTWDFFFTAFACVTIKMLGFEQYVLVVFQTVRSPQVSGNNMSETKPSITGPPQAAIKSNQPTTI
jgi:hypothetical protein